MQTEVIEATATSKRANRRTQKANNNIGEATVMFDKDMDTQVVDRAEDIQVDINATDNAIADEINASEDIIGDSADNDSQENDSASKAENLRNGVPENTPLYVCKCGWVARPFRAIYGDKDETLYKCKKCHSLYFPADLEALNEKRGSTLRKDKSKIVSDAVMEALQSQTDKVSSGIIHKSVVAKTNMNISKTMVDGILDDMVNKGQVKREGFLRYSAYMLVR